jgi:hypothetical protein
MCLVMMCLVTEGYAFLCLVMVAVVVVKGAGVLVRAACAWCAHGSLR